MFSAKFPDSVGGGEIGCAVVKADRGAVNKRTIDQPRPHHPADIGVPANASASPDICPERHILCRLDRETRVRVSDTFRLTGRTGGVEDDERVFSGGGFWGPSL